MNAPQLLVTDVDGTLLDRAGRYAMTREELASVSQRLTIVLASSRTVLELSRNQRDLGLSGPVIAENGAIVALPWRPSLADEGARELIGGREWCLVTLGSPASALREELRSAAVSLGVQYVEQPDRGNALDRRCSVLFRPSQGTPTAELALLVEHLRVRGCSVASGGDWIAVTRGADKGVGLQVLVRLLVRHHELTSLPIAVGDGDNDIPLLHAAARRYVIRDDDGHAHPRLRSIPHAVILAPPGIAGWRSLVQSLVDTERSA